MQVHRAIKKLLSEQYIGGSVEFSKPTQDEIDALSDVDLKLDTSQKRLGGYEVYNITVGGHVYEVRMYADGYWWCFALPRTGQHPNRIHDEFIGDSRRNASVSDLLKLYYANNPKLVRKPEWES